MAHVNGGNGRERGDVAWSWVVRFIALSVFVFAAIGDDTPNLGIAFLAICGAVFPAREFRAFLRSWRQRNGGST